ncbi:MAG: protein kinase [Planctomycetes bacterium]|nr:protein kinase [Planctomycetota bacterium]
MLNCPFCNAELRDADLAQGRCPRCYGVLSWEGTAAAEDSAASAEEAPRSYQEILQTVVEQEGAWAAPPSEPPSAARSEEVAATPPASSRLTASVSAPLSRTVQPRDLSPDEERQVTAMWENAAASRTPLMTLKAEQFSAAAPSNLMIRTHCVAREAPGADYVLLDVIGEGGVGVVYAAQQRSIDRTVALKALRDASRGEDVEQEKFLAEAVVTGELDHPNIVPIYNVGRDERGALFYSMKRVQGVPWSQVVRAKPQAENLEILMKVADAVAFAHARGVVHRDLKPENVMLGDFGEVLVMDWGIALPTRTFSKSGSIGSSTGMGGTPAYMAPEMATGPLDAIGPAADVYLLGAILYEIVTGDPPHTGRDVMECLRAAARNDIVPTEAGGELLEIALQAMSTHPRDRYAAVQDFQAALRAYQSHSQSLALTHRAAEDLQQAHRTGDYQDYARAMFAYQEAVALWDQNEEARLGLSLVQWEYAERALANSDFDLGLSLLDAGEPEHAELRRRLEAAQHERDARQQRLRTARRMTAGLLALIFVIVVGSLFEINRRHNQEIAAKRTAVKKSKELEITVGNLKSAQDTIKSQVTALETANAQVEEEKQAALCAQSQAESARDDAKIAQGTAERARAEEERQGYVAQIGLADQMIADNAFDTARSLLAGYARPEATPSKAQLRHWEWGRLMFLTSRDFATLDAGQRLEAVAVSEDGRRMIAGGLSGRVRLWEMGPVWRGEAAEHAVSLDHGGPVYAVAFSRDGAYAATAGAGGIKVWDVSGDPPATPVQSLTGHLDDVLSVTFSRDGRRILSASRDFTARLWDWQEGRQMEALRGHHDPVHCAAFSYDESRVVTGGEDRVVMVWRVGADEKPLRFFGHEGPVYAAAFTPPDESGAERIVSAGYDKNILLWDPDDLRPYDYATLDVLSGDEPLPDREAIFPNPELRTLSGHTAAVHALRVSRDGRRLVSAAHDNSVKVWDLSDDSASKPLRTLRGHGGWVRSCDSWAEGQMVVSGGYDAVVKVWDVTNYEEERALAGHEDAVLSAAFSPSGDRVVTAGRDRVAKVWPVEGGEPITLNEGPEFLVLGAVFFNDGRTLATSSGDNTVRKWNCASGGQEPFQGSSALRGTGRRGALAVTHDGRLLITGSDDPLVKVWDSKTGALLDALAGHNGEATALAVSPDDQMLASGNSRGLCILWRRDGDSWRELRQLRGHTPGHAITAIRFLPGGGQLLTASEDNSVGRWDTSTGEELLDLTLKHADSVKSLGLSRDGRWALTVTAAGLVHRWSLVAATSDVLNEEATPAEAAVLAADGETAIVAFRDGRLRRYTFTTGPRATARPTTASGEPWTPQAYIGEVWSMAFTPGGDELLTVGGNHARLWDVQTGRKTRTFSRNGVLTSAAFSPGGDRVATASLDGTAKVWDVASAHVIRQFTDAHQGLPIHSVAFSPVAGDERVATAGADGAVRLWNAETGELMAVFDRPRGPVRSARFSPDATQIVTAGDDGASWLWTPGETEVGHELHYANPQERRPLLFAAFDRAGKRLIAGGEDNTARIWTTDGLLQLSLRGHTAPVTAAAFSPDGRRVITAGEDNIAKLWDAGTGKEILTLKRHGQALTAAAFSPDGRIILTASRDATSILWPSAPSGR